MSIPTYVITLPEAKGRQRYITNLFAKHGLEYEFFEASDTRTLKPENYPNYNRLKRALYYGRDLTGGEIGILQSSKRLYEKMISENIPQALIFEDDVTLHGDFKAVLNALINGPQDYELVRFLGSEKVAQNTQYQKRKVTDAYTLNRLLTTPGGAFAYVITQNGAQKLLSAMQNTYLPIDTLMGHCWKTGLDAYIIQPGLAEQKPELDQYIGKARFDKTNQFKGFKKAIYPVTRAFFKIRETTLKRMFYWYKMLPDKALNTKKQG